MIGTLLEELEKDHLCWRVEFAASSVIPISKKFQLLWFYFFKLQIAKIYDPIYIIFQVLYVNILILL